MKNYLLDSHTLLWYLGGDAELPLTARETITNPANAIFVSVASLWEIAIKHSLGKLDLPRPFSDLEPSIQKEGFEVLPIQFHLLKAVVSLPFHHRDPFDRIIIAQSLLSTYPVIGKDEAFDPYGVQRCWTSF